MFYYFKYILCFQSTLLFYYTISYGSINYTKMFSILIALWFLFSIYCLFSYLSGEIFWSYWNILLCLKNRVHFLHQRIHYHYFTLLRVFHTKVGWWLFAGVWVTASLLISPGLFSIFWPIVILLSVGWSPLVLLFPNHSLPVPIIIISSSSISIPYEFFHSSFPWILLSSLVDVNAVVWMISSRPPISRSSCTFTKRLKTIPSIPITNGITVNFMFHSCFSSPARYLLSFRLL